MLYKYSQDFITSRHQVQSSNYTENEIIPDEEIPDINLLFYQIDDHLSILRNFVNNYTSEDFQKSLFFFLKSTDNLNFISIFGEKKNEQYLELLSIMLSILGSHSDQFHLNVSAIHILNNILLRKFDNENRNCIEVTEYLLFEIYNIFDYFSTLYFTILSDEYIPMLYECFKLAKKLFILDHGLYDKKSFKDMPVQHQDLFKNTIEHFKKIILIENVEPCILKEAFKNLTKFINEESSICDIFVENDFIDICFNFMKNRNPAFSEIVGFLAWLSVNNSYALSKFPVDYPEIIFSFMVEESSDEILDSIYTLVEFLSYSQGVSKKMIALDGFLLNLLNNDKSYLIRIRSLDLLNSLIIGHFSDMEFFFEENPSFDIFLDYFYTDDQDIIKLALGIICQITQYICSHLPSKLPNYIISLLQSQELIDQIDTIRINSEKNHEASTLAMSNIEYLIRSYKLNIPFDYKIEYDDVEV